MNPKMHIHRITEIKISEMQSSDSTDIRCYWRDVIFVCEDGTTFEITSFPVKDKTVIPVCLGDEN
jgi:hypothetical protein